RPLEDPRDRPRRTGRRGAVPAPRGGAPAALGCTADLALRRDRAARRGRSVPRLGLARRGSVRPSPVRKAVLGSRFVPAPGRAVPSSAPRKGRLSHHPQPEPASSGSPTSRRFPTPAVAAILLSLALLPAVRSARAQAPGGSLLPYAGVESL